MIDFGEMKGKKWEGRIRSFEALKIKNSENGKGSINWNSVLVEWNWFHIARYKIDLPMNAHELLN